MKQKIILIDKLLKKVFGTPHKSKISPDPVNLLIATILSQNTNDRNSFRAYKNLKNNFSNWEDVAKLKTNQIEKLIRIAGLGKQKSKAIKNFLSSLIKEKGSVSLDHIRHMNTDAVLSELTKYPGIGVKTASCVLLFSLNRDICPVDTHVHRTLNRIGLVKTMSPDKTFHSINKDFPKNTAHSFHTNLIRLGREICKPAFTDCRRCPVVKICKYENKILIIKESLQKDKSFMLLDNI